MKDKDLKLIHQVFASRIDVLRRLEIYDKTGIRGSTKVSQPSNK